MAKKKNSRNKNAGGVVDKSNSSSQSDIPVNENMDTEDENTNYVMGQIVVDDGTVTPEDNIDEYEEIEDGEPNRSARGKLMGTTSANTFESINPSEREDFLEDSYFDSDDWPTELE